MKKQVLIFLLILIPCKDHTLNLVLNWIELIIYSVKQGCQTHAGSWAEFWAESEYFEELFLE